MPRVYVLSAEEPPVSVVVPHKSGEPFNDLYLCENDELIIVRGGSSIGDARIAGAEAAENEWIVQLDADAIYPPEYILRVKHYIREFGDEIFVMCARRKGGFGNLFWSCLESGLVARKDAFLERSKSFFARTKWYTGRRKDVGLEFQDAVPIPVYYYHGLTKGEKSGLLVLATMGCTCAGIVALTLSPTKVGRFSLPWVLRQIS